MPTPLLILLSSAAQAAPLSLDQAVVEALRNNPDLQGAQLATAQAEQQLAVAKASSEPALGVSGGYNSADSAGFIAGTAYDATSTRLSSGLSVGGNLAASGTSWSLYSNLEGNETQTVSDLTGDTTQSTWQAETGVELSQDVLAPFRRSAERQAQLEALDNLTVTQIQSRQQEQEALAQVAEAWWSWAVTSRSVELAEQELARAKELERVSVLWSEEGMVSASELGQTRLARLQAQQSLLDAQNAEQQAADTLLLLIGHDPGEAIEVAGDGALRGHLAEAGTDELMEGNLELAALRAQAEAQGRQVDFAESDRLPTLDLTASAGVASLEDNANAALSALGTDDRLPSMSAGLELTVPLGNKAARSQLELERLMLQQAELDTLSGERSVRAEVLAAARDRDQAAQQTALALEQLAVAREVEAAEEAQLQEGNRRMDELLEAREDRISAEQALLEAELEQARAELELARLAGRVDEVL